MPYISQFDRDQLEKRKTITTAGELNYLTTSLIKQYLTDRPLSYQAINDVLGALEGAKMEFYRRVVVPYENEKLSSNGDVY